MLGLGLFTFQAMNVQADDTMQMYRLYNPNSGEHFYTGYTSEKNHLVEVGWKDEGIAWYAPLTGNPVYRLYNPNSGDHHYTMSYQESQNLIQKAGRTKKLAGIQILMKPFHFIDCIIQTQKSVPIITQRISMNAQT